MVYVLGVFALGLAIAAYKARDRSSRIFLALCCALNLAGAAKAIAEKDPFAFKLRPNDGKYEPAIRR